MGEIDIPVTEQLFPIELDDEIAELERELRMRKRVYAELVGTGRMSPAKADRQMAVLASAIDRLKGCGRDR